MDLHAQDRLVSRLRNAATARIRQPNVTTIQQAASGGGASRAVALGAAPIVTGGAGSMFQPATLAGTLDAANKVFTYTAEIVSGTEVLFHNGLKLHAGAGNDYTIDYTAKSITFTTDYPAPHATDVLELYGAY